MFRIARKALARHPPPPRPGPTPPAQAPSAAGPGSGHKRGGRAAALRPDARCAGAPGTLFASRGAMAPPRTRGKKGDGDTGQRSNIKQERRLKSKQTASVDATLAQGGEFIVSGADQRPGVRMLLDEAQEQLERMNIASAVAKLAEAYKAAPNDVEVLDAYGALLAETGDLEGAEAVLRRAIEIMPQVGWEKYMCLGQILPGTEGVAMVRQGVKMLFEEWQQNLRSKAIVKTDPKELKAQLGRALCCLGEMLLSEAHSQAADGGGLEVEECESVLKKAASLLPTSPEPLQALAALRFEQERKEEACELLRKSVEMWLQLEDNKGEVDHPVAAHGKDGAEVLEAEENNEDHWLEENGMDELPSLEFRFEAAKLLLEMEQPGETELALEVLQRIVEENDTVVDVWYLLAVAQVRSHNWCVIERDFVKATQIHVFLSISLSPICICPGRMHRRRWMRPRGLRR
eukprot:scaffold1811_cov411-Prasinococcus_capsulatus_cf.AAC.11